MTDTCSHVYTITPGKDYAYCPNPGTVDGTVLSCPEHRSAESTDLLTTDA